MVGIRSRETIVRREERRVLINICDLRASKSETDLVRRAGLFEIKGQRDSMIEYGPRRMNELRQNDRIKR